jgi:hypothetical protein
MDIIISESKLTNVIHNFLNMSFEGFNNCDYDWANYNCGLGICCDPYAIVFTLPQEDELDNYLFKLVDNEHYDYDGDYPKELGDGLPEPCHNSPDITEKRFDTIILSYNLFKRLNDMFGNITIWKEPVLSIINKVYNTNADSLIKAWWF